ncbi:NAD(P)-dependent oxidoreductase [Mucilaginibacter sp. HC2]|uniref:NAD-dependent epimerase/dehydratase family protein n=1 Tax=Mucilaginibacter inviolabilis TaxID=2714892 RepID=UPI00140804DC|nr:NAD(P)-dependent oxidoreductase [Mucilaginibacter inviolabilis]NHA04794.1 NAD(P)-dependent oxidoreductase [Mucilaginibacter inviolabilis]
MAKVFITGITGFLGSNIATYLVEQGHTLAATYRDGSSKHLCKDFEDRIIWILQDGNSWLKKAIDFEPEIVIHSAWIGVGHLERNVWEIQSANIVFTEQVLSVAQKAMAKKFISLGSQAEYGVFDGCITEEHALSPTEAYGCVKLVCAELVKQFCNHNKIDWFWLRLFSFFGKGESEKWLIPTLVNKLLTTDQMDLTPGEQKYAYLYVEDLGRAINQIININGTSGAYNISGKNLVSLRSLVEFIRDQINPLFLLNFSKLSYRENQPMHMQGNVSKFVNEFGEFEISDFKESLILTINHIKELVKNINNESI